MSSLKELHHIFVYGENIHLEKRIASVERALREIYKWSDEDILRLKSLIYKNKGSHSVSDYCEYVELFHNLYTGFCLRMRMPFEGKTEEQVLRELLEDIQHLLKIFPIPPI